MLLSYLNCWNRYPLKYQWLNTRVDFFLQRSLSTVGEQCSCSGQCWRESLQLEAPTRWPPARRERGRTARDVLIISDQNWWPTFLLTQSSVPSLEGKQVWCTHCLFAIANMYVNMLTHYYTFGLLYILYVQYCWFVWSLCLNFFLLFISSLFHGTVIYFSC